jgi:hypothetical protein
VQDTGKKKKEPRPNKRAVEPLLIINKKALKTNET